MLRLDSQKGSGGGFEAGHGVAGGSTAMRFDAARVTVDKGLQKAMAEVMNNVSDVETDPPKLLPSSDSE